MGAGRPNNSITPAWRSYPAKKVAAYRFLMANKKQKATKAGCAKYMGIARGTVIKWWDAISWEKEDFKNIIIIKKYWNEYRSYAYNVDRIMKKYGFWYFCNVDSARYWIQLTDGYMRMGRVNTDGERMHLTLKNLNNPDVPNRLEYFFDVTKVYDNSRPAWPD